MGMADAIPKIKLMGSAYSLSHFSLGLRIKRPQITITSAETAMTHTGIKPEVAENTVVTPSLVTVREASLHSRETSQNTKPRNAAIIPINSAA